MTADKEKTATEFLMMEYQELIQEYGHVRDEGIKRLNFYLTITSSILGGLVLLSQISLTPMAFQIATIGASFFLLLIGLPIFRYTIYRDKNSDTLLREISRIRQYFVSQNPSIERYVSRPINDEPTGVVLRNTSNVRVTIQSIIALLIGAIVGLLINFATDNPLISGATGSVIFIVVYYALNTYAKAQYKKAKDAAAKSVRFPKKTG
jgi:hypothetical protein